MKDREAQRQMEGKTRLISPERPTVSAVNASTNTTRQEAEGDRDNKRRRVDEPGSPVSTVAQDEVSTSSPVPFDSETRNDEIAVDVPLPEEPTEMSGESGQGWITEEAFFTVSPGARQVRQRKEVRMSQLSQPERREFLVSMEVEWQTLLKNLAAEVLFLEETAQARARWPDRAMDTRWARTWKPDDSKPSGRRAKARLIMKGFTDPNFLDIESHSPTLTREGFLTVLQFVCSRGHKLQFGDVQQAFNTGDPIKREQPLFVRMPPMESQMSPLTFGKVAQDSQWTGRWHERMEKLYPCRSKRSGI